MVRRTEKVKKVRNKRKVRELIPVDTVFEDGIFLSGGKYSKVFMFSDVNYSVLSLEEKTEVFLRYSDILGSLDSDAESRLSINLRQRDTDALGDILIPHKADGLDGYRDEYNHVITDKAYEKGYYREMYLTVTVSKASIDDARAYFDRVEKELKALFNELGSELVALSSGERINILAEFFGGIRDYDLHEDIKLGHDFRDFISPDYYERHSDYVRLGEQYARVLFMRDYPAGIRDNILTKLTEHDGRMMLSIDILPVPTVEAVKMIERKSMATESTASMWQRRQNQNGNFSAKLPYDMELQRSELRALSEDLISRDKSLMLAMITVMIVSDSKEQLERDTRKLISTAKSFNCRLAVMKYQQTDALKTVLPFGVRRLDNAFRTLTNESLAAFMPFCVKEVNEKGGAYFGTNSVNGDMIICNPENLLNQSMFILGVPGSGKSFFAKLRILYLSLSTDDDILICDPESEFSALVKAMGGEVITIKPGGKHHINAMDLSERTRENISRKAQFILSLIQKIFSKEITAQHKSVLDRCVNEVYGETEKSTLHTLREKLSLQGEFEAEEISLALEMFTTGSLDIFSKETNVNTDSRIISFDIHELSEDMKTPALLTITDSILNRVNENHKAGRRTHIFVDEFHKVYENEYGASFFNSAWRQFRKRGAYPCAITQNIEYLLDSVQASSMLSNSEFIVMFEQSQRDRSRLAELLNVSEEQLSNTRRSKAGLGVMKYGKDIIPFECTFPKGTKIYEMISTKAGEFINS